MRPSPERLRVVASARAAAAERVATVVPVAPAAGGLPRSIPSDRYEQESAAGKAETAMGIVGRLQ